MDKNIPIFVLVFAVVVVMAWGISSTISGKSTAKYQYYENLKQTSGTECGDLNDNGNVQHLSHHPDQYAECIKKVDPAKFKEAVGQEKDAFMKANGIV